MEFFIATAATRPPEGFREDPQFFNEYIKATYTVFL